MRNAHGIVLGCVLALACACGGKSSVEEQRRAVLAPVNVKDKQRELYEKLRFLDEAGNIVPSDTKVAGVVLPRGLTQVSALEREWYFESQLPRPKIEKYFREHLEGGETSTPNPETIEILRATPKDTKGAVPVLVRIFPAPGRYDIARVYMRQAAPMPLRSPSEAEVREQMALRAKRAE